MTNYITVEIPLAFFEELKEALEICAQDLSTELDERYPEASRTNNPTYCRRWEDAMKPVVKAQKLLKS